MFLNKKSLLTSRVFKTSITLISAFVLTVLALGVLTPAQIASGAAQATDLQIKKIGPVTAFAGDTLTYTILVTNATGSTLSGVVITDTWNTQTFTGVYAYGGSVVVNSFVYITTPVKYAQFSLDPLAAGAAGRITMTMSITTALQPRYQSPVVGPTILGNSVVITTSNSGVLANTDRADTAIVGPLLVLSKVYTPTNPRIGRLLTYTLKLDNKFRSDSIDATNVVITERLPLNTQFYAAYPPEIASYYPATNTVQWNLTQTVPVSGTAYVTLTVQISPTAPYGNILNSRSNCAARADALPIPIFCTADVYTLVGDAFEKAGQTVSPPSQSGTISRTFPNRVMTYTVSVYNPFSTTASGLVVTDVLPTHNNLPGQTFVYSDVLASSPPTLPTVMAQSAAYVAWQLPDIAGWGLYTFTFRVLVPPQMYIADNATQQLYQNRLSGRYASLTLTTNDGSHDDSMKVLVMPQIQIFKTVSPTQQLFGQPVTYTLVVSNSGPTTIRDIQLTDVLPTVNGTPQPCRFQWNSFISGTVPSAASGNLVSWSGITLTGYASTTLAVFRATVLGVVNTNCNNTVGGYSPDTYIVTHTNLAPVTILPPFVFSKTVDPASVVLSNSIQYTVSLFNNGGVSVTLNSFTDTLPAGFYYNGNPAYVDNSDFILLPNQANYYQTTFQVDVISTSISCDNLPSAVYQDVNKLTMSISSPPDLAGLWRNSVKIAPVLVRPQAQVSKVANPLNWLPGDVVTYTIVLSNNTSAPITSIRLTDTLPTGFVYGSVLPGTPTQFAVSGPNVFWIGLSLPGGIGMTSTLAFTATVPITVGNYTNQVKASSLDDSLICIPKATSTGAVKAGLVQINKTATPNSVSPLGQFVYNISLSNVGPYTVTLSRFTETLPGVSGYLWKFVSMQSGDPLPSQTEPVVWTNLSIGSGKTQNLRFTVRTETQVGIYPNLIYQFLPAGYMTGTLPARWMITATNGYNNSPVTVVPGVGLAKDVDRDNAHAGEVVTYTITIANFTGQTINNMRITDTLPSGFTWDSYVSGDVPIASNPIVWSSGSMANGTTKILVFRAYIADNEASGTYYNRVTVTADSVSIAPLTNAAPVVVSGIPALNLSKAVEPSAVAAGHFVTYTLDLANPDITDTVTARVTDTLPISFSFAGMISGTAPDITGTEIVWINFQVSPNSSQQLSFKALVSPDVPDGTYTNQLDGSSAQIVFQGSGPTAPVLVVHSPAFDVQISKTDAAYTNTVGGTRVYTLYYTNTLNALGLTAQNVIVTDTFSPPDYLIADAPGWTQAAAGVYTYSIGDLPAGASGWLTLALTVSPTIPVDYLTVTNTAQISADAPVAVPEAIEQPTSNNTSIDVDIIRSANLTVNVVGSGTVDQNPLPPYAVGDVVTLTANAATGWSFTGWSGDLAGTTSPITITLNSDKVVTATFAIKTYIITPTAGANGSITPSTPQLVNYGSSITFTIIPSTGYHIADVGVDGASQGAVGSYTFNTITTSHTITAAFAINTYVITPTAGSNGSITPGSPQTVNYGSSIMFTITANTGYHTTDVRIDGVSQGILSSYIFTNVVTNHTITSAYAINTYIITPTAGSNGSITPSTPQTVNYGSSITFTIAANTGYHTTDVRVDGVSQGVLSSYTFTNVVANHTLTSAYAINTYIITPTAGSNGSITPSTPQTVNYGSSITFTIAANTGYHTTDVRVDGVSQGVLSSYTFTNVVANHTITSAYAINTYLVTPTAGLNGSITPSTPQTVNYGSSITFTIAANTGYHTTDVRVDGVSQGVLSSYTFTNVVANHSITSAYAINTYLITPTTGSNGSITPSTPQTVNYGSSITFTIAANTGYHTTDVRVDGVSQGVLSSYTFTNVVANHTITSAYAINTYIITPTAGSNGSITPSNPQTVSYGSSITFTIVANTGYHTTDVRVDGVSQGAIGTYTFNNVTASHTLTAAFTINTYTLTVATAGNGSGVVSPTVGVYTYNYGSIVTPTASASTGSTFSGWSGNCSGTGTCTLTLTANKSVTATFTLNTYVITPTAGSNGSITPGTPQTVNYGSSITFTIAANTGYHTTDVRVDGVSQGVLSSYTFTNVVANHIITSASAINTYVITPTAGSNGSITPSTPQTVNYGSSITFTIAANTGYHTTDVRVDGVSQGVLSSYTFTNVVANHSLTSAYAINTYLITPTAGSNGSITPSTPQTVNYGSSITFTIVPTGGYGIADVRVDGVSQGAIGTYTFNTIAANHTITAAFANNLFVITPTAGLGGSINPSSPQAVSSGNSITFTIVANTGYHTTDVRVDGVSQGVLSSYTFTNVVANHSITSAYAINMYTLTVSSAGAGSGVVTPTIGIHTYPYGTIVTPTASANIGSIFSGWSGDCSGAGTCVVTLTTNRSVTADFGLDTAISYTLAITTAGTGSGSVTPVAGVYTYANGTIVTLTASANIGSIFTGWSGNLTGATSPVSITLNGNKIVTATFTHNPVNLTVNVVGSGTVGQNPLPSYLYSDVVTLTANAATGWSFVGWSGDLTGVTNPVSIILNGNKIVTATFTRTPVNLTVNIVGSGTVGQNPLPSYLYGDVVTLTANAATGWSFVGWSGDLTGATSPVSITLNGNKIVTATFTHNPVNLAVNVVGSGTVGQNPLPSYLYSDVVTLTANAATGWSFVGWSGALTGVTNPAAITLNGDKIVTATFGLACVSVSGVDFSYTPTIPTVGKVITFNGVAVTGTLPITYSWNYGDSSAVGTGSPITHIFPITNTTRSYTVTLTAANACSSQPGAALVTVRPYQLYLPVIMKNTP
jgi:uncharacterized repeat protein (TIGR01451 family)/uncharacterized repeat protein (TIGR02543 family)